MNIIRTLPVPLPPLDEQRRIVAALDDNLSRLEVADSELAAISRRVEHFRDQVLSAVCVGWRSAATTDNVATPPPKAGVADGVLPAVPATWKWVRLGDIADVVGGVTKDAKRQSDPSLPEYPYLRVANVQRGRLDLTNVAKIRVPGAKAAQLRLLNGDVLLNEGGDRDKLGRGWVWEGQIDNCIHQNHVFRARIRDGVLHPKLLAWHANGFGKRWCEANGSQSVNLASISLSKIKQLPVPLPPAEEQEALVEAAELYLSVLDRCEQLIAQARANGCQLRRSLLAMAFTGRLVPQDPTDEPASILLERITREREALAPKPLGRRQPVPQKEALL
jgi:type I restriction enzyme S subunit